MNVRGAAGRGAEPGSPTDEWTAVPADVARKMLAMDGLRPAFRTGRSPAAHNGRYWTPNKRRDEAETARYIRRLVQTCETIRPRLAGNRGPPPPPPKAHITVGQLPRAMQKVLVNKTRNHMDQRVVSDWTPSEFVKDCLFWHNFYRHFHRSPELVLSPRLCEEAQDWANHLAHSDTFAYQNKTDYGQNLLCRRQTDRKSSSDIKGKDVVREWYSTSRAYKLRKNPKMYSANINSGPFTQLVWSSTRELGIGKACSRSGRTTVVANYLPRGNVNGQYVGNVHMNQYFLQANKKKLDDAVSGKTGKTV